LKHVLFITYYFPPSGGSGVQRPLKFVKYLPEFGWKVTVLTVDPAFASYPDLDVLQEAEIGPDTIVIKTRSWDPYSAYARWTGKKKSDAVGVGFLGADHASFKEKIARWIRANLFLPDARVGWVKHARKAGLDAMVMHSFDAIVSTGPPHSSHLIAAFLAKKSNTPWLADIRDAWPDVAYASMLPTSSMARKRDLRIRDRTLKQATACVAVTEDLRNSMQKAVGRPFSLIRNGFDPADFDGLIPKKNDNFTLVHTGNMSPARNPEPIWTLLSDMSSSERWPALRIQCIGNVDSTILTDANRAGAEDRFEIVSYVPHAEALSYTQSASLLLLPINRVNDAAGIVTGKIYEYIASGRPILGLGDPSGEAANILKETGAGVMFSYEDTEEIGAFIDRHYAAWLAGLPLLGANQQRAAAYSRRSQTDQLATLLNSISKS
jgi:glycosyltransferase involved in cell wall biosynthesis